MLRGRFLDFWGPKQHVVHIGIGSFKGKDSTATISRFGKKELVVWKTCPVLLLGFHDLDSNHSVLWSLLGIAWFHVPILGCSLGRGM